MALENEKETSFSVFAQLLHSIIGDKRHVGDFTRTLFENISNIPKNCEKDPLDRVESTYRDYYNGEHDITDIAKAINKHIDTIKFSDYLNSFNEDLQIQLSRCFKKFCPNIDKENFDDEIAQRFYDIIIEAVSNNGKREHISNEEKLKSEYGLELLSEAGEICPAPGCSKLFFNNSEGESKQLYTIIQIDKSAPAEIQNLMALCPVCAEKFKSSKSHDKIEKYKEIKRGLMLKQEARARLSDGSLDDGVMQVLKKIKETPSSAYVPLNYVPVEVREKIREEENILFDKIHYQVINYYGKINEWMKQLDKEKKLRYNQFCHTVKFNYMNLKDLNLSQTDIYERLAEWLRQNTKGPLLPCEIVISYFVQNCEVFEAVSK